MRATMPRDPIPLSAIVSTREIAERYSVDDATVRQWFHRYEGAPEPILVVGTAPIYDMQEVSAWLEEHGPRNLEYHKRRAASP